MLDDFRIAKLLFNFLACGDGRLPEYKGNTLRDGFGYVFRDVVCSKEQKDCGICENRDNCAYVYLFETPVIQPEDKFSKYSDVPRPYIVDLCDTSKSVYARGDPFRFGLVLVGKAIDYLPHFIFCFDELGRRGLGKEKLKFDLQVVSAFDFAKGHWTPIYDPDANLLRDDFPTASAQQLPFNCKDTLTLDFLTPTRIKYREKYITDMEFHVMVRNLLRRITMLMLHHCDSDFDSDVNELIEHAKTVDVLRWDLRWRDWSRYSTRQRVSMELGGFMGSVTYEGDLDKFMPLIALGEQIHIGKNTTFGLGKYIINN